MARHGFLRVAALISALALLSGAHPSSALDRCPGDCDGDDVVSVDELVAGVRRALVGDDGRACEAADADGDGMVTVAELVRAVAAALDGCPLAPLPFTAAIADGALLLTPDRALRGASVYAVVLTTAVRDSGGAPLRAAPDFALARGVPELPGAGPTALFDADPTADGNPYPDGRLVSGSGVIIPDRIARRGLADVPELAPARAALRQAADAIGAAGDFSTTAPIRIALSSSVDLATVDPTSVLLVRRSDGVLALEPLLAQLERQGLPRAQVALAISFPTERIEDDLLAARGRLDERGGIERVSFVDPDPDDDLAIGIFAGTAGPYRDFLAANPAVAAVARGVYPAPDFRGPDGLFDPAALAGTAAPRIAMLDFLLTVPRGDGPHPLVVVQHGFAGDQSFVLSVAGLLAQHGLAAIGIDAVSHGRRGSPLDLLRATALQTRDLFRQTVVDQLALVRALRNGVDVTGDGHSDLVAEPISYLGVSLGGIIGSVFIALEPTVNAAVLNVAGGRVAFLGDNPGTRPIYQAALAEQAALPVGDPRFEVFIQRMLTLGQQALDPADPLNFARRWRADPLPGNAPRRVLLQEGIGDLLVSNESTEALAAAGGLIAQTPQRDQRGVSGLWRFDPPGGHGILSRDDVRRQAVEFLFSGGTEIVAP